MSACISEDSPFVENDACARVSCPRLDFEFPCSSFPRGPACTSRDPPAWDWLRCHGFLVTSLVPVTSPNLKSQTYVVNHQKCTDNRKYCIKVKKSERTIKSVIIFHDDWNGRIVLFLPQYLELNFPRVIARGNTGEQEPAEYCLRLGDKILISNVAAIEITIVDGDIVAIANRLFRDLYKNY